MKKLKYILLFALSGIMLVSCFDEPGIEKIYEGPTFVEWDEAPTDSDGVYLRENTGATREDQFRINLVGPHRDTPTTVTVAVNEELTTAIEGVHYNLGSTTVTIPAGESFGYVDIEVIADNIEADEKFFLALDIVSADVDISPNYSQLFHSLIITCPSSIPLGTYLETGEGGTEVELTEVSPGVYRFSNMNFRYYPTSYGNISGVFEDICGNLTLLGVPVGTAYGIAWVGSGSYDNETNTITLDVADATYNPAYVVSMTFEYQD